jgi:MFS family permease
MAFFAIGTPGIVLGLIALALVHEPPREGQTDGETAAVVPLGTLIARLARTPSFTLMAVGFGLGIMSGISFGYWGPELFARSYAIDPVEAKTAFALNFGLSGLVGMLGFGILADRLSRRSRAWPALLSAMAVGAATVLVIATVWAPSFALAKWLAIPCGLLGGGWSVGLFAALQFMLPSTYRASATALFVAVTTLLGYFIGPWLTGSLSQSLGDNALSLQIALSIVVPAGVVAALLACLAASRLERDRIALAEAA